MLIRQIWQASERQTNMLQLQLLLEPYLALMQSTEFVDLVLILPPNLNLVAAGRSLVFLG